MTCPVCEKELTMTEVFDKAEPTLDNNLCTQHTQELEEKLKEYWK